MPLWAKLNANSDTGYVGGAEYILRRPGLQPGLHFTYPADGKLHYSFQRIFAGRNIFETHYQERCRIKIFAAGGGSKDEITRDPASADLSRLLPKDPQLPLGVMASSGGVYAFPTLSLPIANGQVVGGLAGIGRPPHRPPQPKDVLVSVGQVASSRLHASACLYGPQSRPLPFPDAKYFRSFEQRQGLTLEVFAFCFEEAA